jgi:N-acetylmuramoyl-L-alanine amidase
LRGGAALALVLAAVAAVAGAAASSPPAVRRVEVSSDLTVVQTDGAISVEARPLDGETPIEFASRISANEETEREILALPGGPSRARAVIVPYEGLADEMKRAAVAALFPSDVRATAGWLHIAVGDESLASIALWFAGRRELASALAAENRLEAMSVARGTTVRVPVELLLPPFRDAEALDGGEPPALAYGQDAEGRFATYRLRKSEALYSAVVVRFTGRVHAPDVIELAGTIAKRSGIEDVHAIPVGYPVKIPLDVLSEEFLPSDDPRAKARALERAETAQFSIPARAKGLRGVRIVLDPGHGGRDTGTIHGGVREAVYVYDVAVRLRKILDERTEADVIMTTKDTRLGWKIPERDVLAPRNSQILLTHPPYELDDPVLGVNLRWYLANSLLKIPGPKKKRIPPERTVFVSLHADSLHPSIRGAMIYVPGERFLRDRYGKRGRPFPSYREWREQPVVSFTRKERVASEGASTSLAGKLIGALRRRDLSVHPFSPVRTHVIRAGREWVPAVLRYNRIPNRVLVEIANLANPEDRALVATRRFRQEIAAALAEGLVEFFGGELGPAGRPKTVAASPSPSPKKPVRKVRSGRSGSRN